MKKEEKQFADILEQALALQENGIAPEEILAVAGEEKNELAEILAVAADLKNAKNKIVPERALLEKIIAKTDLVTNSAALRYNKQGVGRLPLINNKFNFLNWKIVAPAGIIIAVLVLFASRQMMPSANKAIPEIAKQAPAVIQNEPAPVAETAIASAKAEDAALAPEASVTGDDETESVGSIIDSLSDDSSSEEAAASDEDADASLLVADSQEIDNFNKIYDEKEF